LLPHGSPPIDLPCSPEQLVIEQVPQEALRVSMLRVLRFLAELYNSIVSFSKIVLKLKLSNNSIVSWIVSRSLQSSQAGYWSLK
jgi:hypothetical protein